MYNISNYNCFIHIFNVNAYFINKIPKNFNFIKLKQNLSYRKIAFQLSEWLCIVECFRFNTLSLLKYKNNLNEF